MRNKTLTSFKLELKNILKQFEDTKNPEEYAKFLQDKIKILTRREDLARALNFVAFNFYNEPVWEDLTDEQRDCYLDQAEYLLTINPKMEFMTENAIKQEIKQVLFHRKESGKYEQK